MSSFFVLPFLGSSEGTFKFPTPTNNHNHNILPTMKIVAFSFLLMCGLSGASNDFSVRHRQLGGINVHVSDDKARSCLDADGNVLRRVFPKHRKDCTYTTENGSFFERCQVFFEEGDHNATLCGGRDSEDPVPAVCPKAADPPIIRDCEDPDLLARLTFLQLPTCQALPNYVQTLTSVLSTKCSCVESYSTPPLVGNCGKIEQFPSSKGEDGRSGCSVDACQDAVCAVDSFCCGELETSGGDLIGWWDRFCISYASAVDECLASK